MKKLIIAVSFLFCFALCASAQTTHKHHHHKKMHHHHMLKNDDKKGDKKAKTGHRETDKK